MHPRSPTDNYRLISKSRNCSCVIFEKYFRKLHLIIYSNFAFNCESEKEKHYKLFRGKIVLNVEIRPLKKHLDH